MIYNFKFQLIGEKNNEFSRQFKKFLLAMKYYLIILFLSTNSVYATLTYAQKTVLSIDMKEKAVSEVLDEIERQSEFRFYYNSRLVDTGRKVTVLAQQASVFDVLDQLFLASNVGYKVVDKDVILVERDAKSNAPVLQGITITGTVTDASGEPLPGVSVVVKGTTQGTAADAKGAYSITVPNSNAVLVFSFVGYAGQEMAVGDRRIINVTLNEDTRLMEEVVVVGYGVQKKINLTGSVAAIGADKLANRPTPNFSTALAGLAPGLGVTQGSGNPGSESVSLQIRGLTSINGGSPMILVDGVQADMNVINPDDVESVSILKDAASAAIYGSRAANGVILVTTKKGKKEKPTITASAMFARQLPVTALQFESDMPTYMRMHNRKMLNAVPNAVSFPYDEQTILDWEAANKNPNGIYTHPVTGNQIPNWLAYPNTDWATVMFQPSMYHRYNITISGGSDRSNYLLSGGYQENPGTLENTSMKRFNIRANVESKIADFLTVGTQTYAVKDYKDPGTVTFNNFNQTIPGITPKYKGLYGAVEDANMNSTITNLLQQVAQPGGQTETTRIYSSWFLNAEIWKGISAEARFNYNETQYQSETYSVNVPCYRFREGTEMPVSYIISLENASSSRSSGYTASYTANLFLRYAGSFGDHDISAFTAYEQYYMKTGSFNASRRGLLDWNVTDITSAATMNAIGGNSKQELAILSYFGRFNYAYKYRYLFEANFRIDGSSRFAPGHRWGNFYAFSAGWRISEESFFEPLKKYVDNLKLKASYGELGNQISGYYDWQAIYGKVDAIFNYGVQSAVIPTQMANFQMSWEKTATSNFGFESNFLKQRLSLEAEYFARKTTDMLVRPPVYDTMGNISVPMTNAATLINKGFDVNVGWNDRAGTLRYSIGTNIGYSINEITKYNGKLIYEADPKTLNIWGEPAWRYTNLSDVSTGGDTRIVEGHPYNEFFLRKPYQGTGTYMKADGTVDPNGGPKDGMIRTKGDLEWVREMIAAGYSFNSRTLDPNAGSLWYGELLMEDANGDGRYGQDDDRVFTGKSSLPRWTFGFNLSVEWKGIDMNMLWAGRLGGYHYIYATGVNHPVLSNDFYVMPANTERLFYSYDAVAAAANDGVNDYDPATDPNANHLAPLPRLLFGSSTMVSSTFHLYNSSYLRLKSLQVGYSLPKKWLDAVKISHLRLFISGENILTVKDRNFPGVDPELGASIAIYPIPKMFTGGLTITF